MSWSIASPKLQYSFCGWREKVVKSTLHLSKESSPGPQSLFYEIPTYNAKKNLDAVL